MRQLMPLFAGMVLLLSAGVVHGLWTERWTSQDLVQQAVARLQTVPLAIGEWRGEELEMDASRRAVLPGALARRYVNQVTGKAVTLYLGCGKPGPASVHTPDICYAGNGFHGEPPRHFQLPDDPGCTGGEFLTARFQKTQAADQSHLRIFWSWNGGDRWRVADNPRLAFAQYSVLYKLYVIREMADPAEPIATEPCIAFLKDLLPELDRRLFSPTATP